MRIDVIGAWGSRLKNLGMTTFLVNNKLAIDAGNIVSRGRKIFDLEHIFLTHQHLDHIADIPYLVAESFPQRKRTLKIYSHEKALESISKHILNTEVWPDFSNIRMLGSDFPSLSYVSISLGKVIDIDGLEVSPFESNHTVKTFGYRVYDRKEGKSFLITGDTYIQDDVWGIANSDSSVRAIFIDVSYPQRLYELGKSAKHLTTSDFEEEIKKIKRKDVMIFVYHLKPAFSKEIKKEIAEIKKRFKLSIEILKDGDVIIL